MNWSFLPGPLGQPATLRHNGNRVVLNTEFVANDPAMGSLTSQAGKRHRELLLEKVVTRLKQTPEFQRLVAIREQAEDARRRKDGHEAAIEENTARKRRVTAEMTSGWAADARNCETEITSQKESLDEVAADLRVFDEELRLAHDAAEKKLADLAGAAAYEVREVLKSERDVIVVELTSVASPVLDKLVLLQKTFELAQSATAASNRLHGLVAQLTAEHLGPAPGRTGAGREAEDLDATVAPHAESNCVAHGSVAVASRMRGTKLDRLLGSDGPSDDAGDE